MTRKLLRLIGLPIVASLFSLLGAGCATSGQGGAASVEESKWWHEGEAVVRGVNGRAEISRDGEGWQSLEIGRSLEEGTRIRTGPDSTVLLDLGETGGGIVKVMPDSVLELEQLGPSHVESSTSAVLNLSQGRVIGDTLKLPPSRKISVKTPEGGYDIK